MKRTSLPLLPVLQPRYCTCSGLLLCRFSAAGDDDLTRALAAGGRKAPRHEIAGSESRSGQRAATAMGICTGG
jgi:hypothetical protein